MFNQIGFNDVAFNRHSTSFSNLSATLSAESSLNANGNISLTIQAGLSSYSELEAKIYRSYSFESHLSSEGSLQSTQNRIRYFITNLSAEANLQVTLSKFHIKELIFIGDFNPGDKIIIDMKSMTLTLNGQNMLRMMEGHFFDFNTGLNTVRYTDESGNRSVLLNITHKDRYI